MFRRLLFLLLNFLVWVGFFELARLFFLLYQWKFTSDLPGTLAWQSLWFGLKMDLSMAAYLTAVPAVFVLLSLFIPFFRRLTAYKWYTGIMLFIQLFLLMVDVEIYRAWGHRVDYTPLAYISNPKEVWASIAHLPIVWILLGLLLVFFLLYRLFIRIIGNKNLKLDNSVLTFLQGAMVLIFILLLIIPIRGGFQLTPLNHSAVYFSNNQFANQAAVNASWNFFHSITHRNEFSENLYAFTSREEAEQIVKDLYRSSGKRQQVIDLRDRQLPNVILILWESFTEKALHIKINGKPVAPRFEELKKEGIYFSNCYSNGDRTNKGLSSVISGYPALPRNSIINYPQKLPKLSGIGKIFSAAGYDNRFYYGGEPEFANIKGYILDQQFGTLVTKDDFRKKDQNSKWGAHDDVVMRRILSDSASFRIPFFISFLTLTSHEPFETPVPVVFPGKSFSTRLLNTIHYTDSCLYAMIQEMKKSSWWENTIVIIVADHGHYEPSTGKRADDYRIPLLWLGGALNRKGEVIDKTVNQLDITKTLLAQLGMDTTPFNFSKDLFDSSARSWAFFTFNDGIGLLTDSSRMVYDNAGKKVVFREGRADTSQVRLSKALMQVVYSDFLSR